MFSFLRHKMINIFEDKSFSEILTGSAFALVARVISAGLALIISLLVARIYGAEVMGILAIVQAFMIMASILAVLGTNVSILRMIPEHIVKYSIASAFQVYRKTQFIVVFASIAVGIVLFGCSDLIAGRIFSNPDYSFYIAITATCVIFKALMEYNTQAVRGLRLIRTFALMQILPHAAMLLILFLLLLRGSQANDPVYAQLFAWGITAIIGVAIMNRAFRQRQKPTDIIQSLPVKDILILSSPMLMTASMTFIVGQVGVLILGIYRSPVEVGYYSAAVKLATLTTFVLQAINSMAAPKFSELFHLGNIDELFFVAKKTTKLIFWTTVPILLLLVFFGHYALSLFGKEFTGAYYPMLILVIGQFVNSVSGPTGHFMNMTGHQRVFRNIIGLASGVSVAFSFLLIPTFGFYGAALAATGSLVLWNVCTLIYIKIKYGMTIGYFPLLS